MGRWSLTAAAKAAGDMTRAVASGVFRFGGRVWGVLYAGGTGRTDYARLVGDGSHNAIIMACVLWLCRTFPEAPIIVQARRPDGGWETIPEHPAAALLARPNPFYSGSLLWTATISDWMLSGNAYWYKLRRGGGGVAELWWIPSWMIEPRFPLDGSAFLTHYDYKPDGGSNVIRLDVQDVVHFRYGLDPENPRRGRSPLRGLLREVFTDDEAGNYTAALLRNMGVPGLIVAPDSDDVELTKTDAEAVKLELEQRFGGDNRGRTMVMTGKTQVHTIGFDPRNMQLAEIRRIPEERISAVLGIPAIVAGLGAGLQRSTFANFKEAREAAYESNVIPTQRLMAEELNAQLIEEWGRPGTVQVAFDLGGVRILQDDANALATRVGTLYEKDVIKRAEARRAVGYDAGPEDDYYRSELAAPAAAAPPTVDVLPSAVRSRRPLIKAPAPDWRALAERDKRSVADAGALILGRLFARTGRAVLETLTADGKRRKAPGDPLPGDLPESFDSDLAAAFAELHGVSIDRAAATVAGGLDVSFQLPFDVRSAIVGRLAARVVGVTETTRAAVADSLAEGVTAGETLAELRSRILDLFDSMSSGRAMTIARTESGTAYNAGTIASYRESGVVRAVRVHDGDGCGWTSHDDSDVADGSERTFEEAEAHPLAHPNCVRGFAPIVAD